MAAQSHQKSYFDIRRWQLEIDVGYSIYLKISPTKRMKIFGKKGKISPLFIGP